MIFQCCDTLLPKDIVVGRPLEGPFIHQVVYNKASQHLFLQWDPTSNITKYNIQIFTCSRGDSMLMNITINTSCSVFQLSGVNFTKYGLLLIAVKSCVTDDECGIVDLPEKNVVLLNFTNAGKIIITLS